MLRTSRLLIFLFSFALIVAPLVGCSSSSKKSDDFPPAEVEQLEGETTEGETPSNPEIYGPEPVRTYPVVLVLGPGMARGFAYAGVLRALSDAKIPIGAVIGTEMGALIGGVFAYSKSINEFEWKLLKFKEDVFSESSFSLSKWFGKPNSGRRLQAALTKTLGKRDVSDSKIPLRFGIFWDGLKDSMLIERGSAIPAIRASMADPLLFQEVQWEGAAARTASKERPFPVNEARSLAIGPVVVIDVIDDERLTESKNKKENEFAQTMALAKEKAKSELTQADLVIQPDMRGIGYFDFRKRTKAVYRGRVAAKRVISELRQMVGQRSDSDE